MRSKYISLTMVDKDRIDGPCKNCCDVKVIIVNNIRKFGCNALGGSLLMEHGNTFSQLIDCPKREKKLN